ncbi:YggS family pyridoxal phosphate-dependent enzyme [Rhizobium sp. FKL33]|uniref:YggS family pyridoxal phosphate-dependent enzyme n=1 Tax=Rhizobium sp. FKL33 TaxID=2562307 RepID=UPI0010C01E2B|nr:YggS family pyridoxal phosphate-dependent enzyme [Rhizobium sp. FKL33]
MSTVERYHEILARIAKAADEAGKAAPQLVAVTKTFSGDEIRPVIEAGHRVFGENRVQEAEAKWPALRSEFAGIELRLIGPLQSNKAEYAVALFDVIETVDREKIARALKAEMDKQGRSPRLYVQINTGREPQKAGVAPDDAPAFLSLCRNELGLAIEGLMCIPPADENPGPHFALLAKLARENGVDKMSMGMSGDFEIATAMGATSVRVGSAIFGSR